MINAWGYCQVNLLSVDTKTKLDNIQVFDTISISIRLVLHQYQVPMILLVHSKLVNVLHKLVDLMVMLFLLQAISFIVWIFQVHMLIQQHLQVVQPS